MSFITYLRNVRAELKHVVFPNVQTAIAHTALVIVIGAIVAAIVALFDAGFTRVVELLIVN